MAPTTACPSGQTRNCSSRRRPARAADRGLPQILRWLVRRRWKIVPSFKPLAWTKLDASGLTREGTGFVGGLLGCDELVQQLLQLSTLLQPRLWRRHRVVRHFEMKILEQIREHHPSGR